MRCKHCQEEFLSLDKHAKTCRAYAYAAIDCATEEPPKRSKQAEYSRRKQEKRKAEGKCLRCGKPRPCQCSQKYFGGLCKCGAQAGPRAKMCKDCKRLADYERYHRVNPNARTFQVVDYAAAARKAGFQDMETMLKERRAAGATYVSIAREIGLVAPATLRTWAYSRGLG